MWAFTMEQSDGTTAVSGQTNIYLCPKFADLSLFADFAGEQEDSNPKAVTCAMHEYI